MSARKPTRLSPRTRITAAIPFQIVDENSQGGDLTLESENISEGGAFLKVSERKIPFKVGMVLDLRFSLPREAALFKAQGKVIWTTEGSSEDMENINGMGIQFMGTTSVFREAIRRFIVENLDK